MMISGQPLLRRVLQDRAHHAAQGILGKKIVAEVIDSHGNQRTYVRDQMSEHRPAADSCPLSSDIWPLKWRLLLPGASEPRLKLLRPQGFRSVFRTALRGQGNRSIVVVGNYESGPIR